VSSNAARLTLILAAASCGRAPPRAATQELDTQALRFPHARHADIACTDCHPRDAVLAGRLARPGTTDHAPCDRGNCHHDDFTREPGELCGLCHDSVDPTGAEASPLTPYPPAAGARALASAFSHTTHVDWPRLEAAVGFHVACTDCHPRGDDEADPRLPDHASCLRCHAAEAAPEGAPTMDDCAACHRPRDRAPTRTRSLIRDDLRFAHGAHGVDRRGQPIRCVVCHVDIARVAETDTHAPPPTSACVECHDDEARTPTSVRMRICEACHLSKSESFGTLAPRSHLPASERPENHTLAFRSDHGQEARRDAAGCAKCHLTMSGSARDVCDECHQSMRPRDHTVGWRDFEHGPQAATNAQACATCHEAGFCISCHARPPRSHFQRLYF
jgi:hypothetical protein